jgi:hypothetical protein
MQKIKTGNNSEPNKVVLQSSLLPQNVMTEDKRDPQQSQQRNQNSQRQHNDKQQQSAATVKP